MNKRSEPPANIELRPLEEVQRILAAQGERNVAAAATAEAAPVSLFRQMSSDKSKAYPNGLVENPMDNLFHVETRRVQDAGPATLAHREKAKPVYTVKRKLFGMGEPVADELPVNLVSSAAERVKQNIRAKQQHPTPIDPLSLQNTKVSVVNSGKEREENVIVSNGHSEPPANIELRPLEEVQRILAAQGERTVAEAATAEAAPVSTRIASAQATLPGIEPLANEPLLSPQLMAQIRDVKNNEPLAAERSHILFTQKSLFPQTFSDKSKAYPNGLVENPMDNLLHVETRRVQDAGPATLAHREKAKPVYTVKRKFFGLGEPVADELPVDLVSSAAERVKQKIRAKQQHPTSIDPLSLQNTKVSVVAPGKEREENVILSNGHFHGYEFEGAPADGQSMILSLAGARKRVKKENFDHPPSAIPEVVSPPNLKPEGDWEKRIEASLKKRMQNLTANAVEAAPKGRFVGFAARFKEALTSFGAVTSKPSFAESMISENPSSGRGK